MLKVVLTDEQSKVHLSKALQNRLCKMLREAAKMYDLPKKCEMGVLLTDNARIKKINYKYRNKNEATDVISFALNDDDDSPEQENSLLGDVIISVERAVAQAKEYEHSLERELLYLAIHGFLHLLGYDHMEPEDKQEMRAQEEAILSEMGLSRD